MLSLFVMHSSMFNFSCKCRSTRCNTTPT